MKDNKKVSWPNGAKCAFSFAFDLDGDTIWRNKVIDLPGGDSIIRSKSIGLYGVKRGTYRLLDIMNKYGLKCTFYIPAENVLRYPELAKEIQSEGHEIGNHGLDHRGFYGNTPEEQLANIKRSQEIFEDILGKRSSGYRPTGTLMKETENALFNDPDTLYYSRGVAEEKIKFMESDKGLTRTVNLPCRIELDEYLHMVYDNYPPIPVGQGRIAPYEDVFSNFIREIEGGMRFNSAMTTAFHPQVSGSPGKSKIIELMCDYITSSNDIWCTTCENIAYYWREKMEEE